MNLVLLISLPRIFSSNSGPFRATNVAVLSTIPTEFFKVLLMLSMSGYDILFQVITSDFRWRIDDSNSNWHDTFLLMDYDKDFKVFCIKFE